MPTYQLTMRATMLGQEVRNIFYYTHTQLLDAAGKQSACDALSNDLRDNLQTFLASDFTSYAVDIRRVDVPSLPTETFVAFLQPWSGTNTSGPIATQTSMLVSFRAATAPPNKAKTYIAGPTKTAIVAGLWTSGLTTALSAWGTDSLTLSGIQGEDMPRVSARWTGTPPAVTVTNPLVSVIVPDVPATQRRRRIGSGE